jgi:hypothetical protein
MTIKVQRVVEVEKPENVLNFGKVMVDEFQDRWNTLRVKSLTDLVFEVVLGDAFGMGQVIADVECGQSFKPTSDEKYSHEVVRNYNEYAAHLSKMDSYLWGVIGIRVNIDVCMVLFTDKQYEPMSIDDLPCIQITITSNEEQFPGNQFQKTRQYRLTDRQVLK